MSKKSDLEQMIIENKPVQCAMCKGKMFYIHSGIYKCQGCGYEEMDDYGKVKHFLEENGHSPAVVISQATGVSTEVIGMFLKQGRVQIPEGSKYYLKCEKCGCSIRYGRFCPSCARELAGGIRNVIFADVGEKPKSEMNLEGKMHYLKKKSKK